MLLTAFLILAIAVLLYVMKDVNININIKHSHEEQHKETEFNKSLPTGDKFANYYNSTNGSNDW